MSDLMDCTGAVVERRKADADKEGERKGREGNQGHIYILSCGYTDK